MLGEFVVRLLGHAIGGRQRQSLLELLEFLGSDIGLLVIFSRKDQARGTGIGLQQRPQRALV